MVLYNFQNNRNISFKLFFYGEKEKRTGIDSQQKGIIAMNTCSIEL